MGSEMCIRDSYRKPIENLSKTYRKPIENLSNIYRTSIEHLSKIYRKSIDPGSTPNSSRIRSTPNSTPNSFQTYRKSISHILKSFFSHFPPCLARLRNTIPLVASAGTAKRNQCGVFEALASRHVDRSFVPFVPLLAKHLEMPLSCCLRRHSAATQWPGGLIPPTVWL